MRDRAPRLLGLRLLWDDVTNAARGWRMAPHGAQRDLPGWPVLGEARLPIRVRPELGPHNAARVHNMALCARLIHGLRLQPGEVFSMRRVVGDPSPARGFQGGPMLVGGRIAISPGGGLCQVATALFNAALQANLEVLEKWNHSVDVWGAARMVDLGRDATYVHGRRDVKFRNDTDDEVALVLEVDVEARALSCAIVSPGPSPGVVEVRPEVVGVLWPRGPVRAGQEVRHGWVVVTTRTVSLGGAPRVTYRRVERYRPAVLEPAEGPSR